MVTAGLFHACGAADRMLARCLGWIAGRRPVPEDPFFWDRPAPPRRRRPSRRADETPPDPAQPAPDIPVRPAEIGRLTLREAADQYGVSASTLGSWCRAGTVDGVKVAGPGGERWMVEPASVERRLSQQDASPRSARPQGRGMLVPRDAWDRLLAQLTHLHETGQQLAEARERAARAETEAAFLRERLAEMRTERDEARSALRPPDPAAPGTGSPEPRPGFWRRLFGGAG